MDIGFDLLKNHLDSPYPTECRGVEINGVDLVLLSADTVGCITTYYGRFGNIKKLDSKRVNILKQCRNELAVVVEELDSFAKEYFKGLLTLTDIVLTELNESKNRTPDELYKLIDHVILELEALTLDARPLQDVQKTGFTTSSEWLGELGKAVREVQKQKIEDGTVVLDLLTIMHAVHKAWPHM